MSRDVLLNVTSSAIELPDAMTIQTMPIAIEGRAATSPARRPTRAAPLTVTAGGGGAAARPATVEDVSTAMTLAR